MFSQPRHLLLLAPFALLGAALLLRARLPRPQSEGDKWLWEQVETAYSLNVVLPSKPVKIASTRLQLVHTQCIDIRERTGMRALLRAFQRTNFVPTTSTSIDMPNRWTCLAQLFPIHRGNLPANGVHEVRLYQKNGHIYLWRNNRTQTLIDAASDRRFRNILHTTIARAVRQEPGYAMQTYEENVAS